MSSGVGLDVAGMPAEVQAALAAADAALRKSPVRMSSASAADRATRNVNDEPRPAISPTKESLGALMDVDTSVGDSSAGVSPVPRNVNTMPVSSSSVRSDTAGPVNPMLEVPESCRERFVEPGADRAAGIEAPKVLTEALPRPQASPVQAVRHIGEDLKPRIVLPKKQYRGCGQLQAPAFVQATSQITQYRDIIKPIVQEVVTERKVPVVEYRTVAREQPIVEVVEKQVQVPQVRLVEVVEEVPLVLVQERLVKVPVLQKAELCIEVPKVEYEVVPREVVMPVFNSSEMIVDVPMPLMQETVVEVPQVEVVDLLKQVPRPEVQAIPKQVVLPEVQVVERLVDVPSVTVREELVEVPVPHPVELVEEVPLPEIQEVHRMVDKPVVEVVEKVVEVVVPELHDRLFEETDIEIHEIIKQVPKVEVKYIEKRVPIHKVEYVETLVEVTDVFYEERIVEVPEIEVREVIKQVPKFVVEYVDKPVPKHVMNYIERVMPYKTELTKETAVEVPQAAVVETVTQIPKVEVKEVPKPIPRYQIQAQEKVVEVPAYLQQEIPVNVPEVQVVDVITEVARPYVEEVDVPVPRIELKGVERIMEVPQLVRKEVLEVVPQVQDIELVKEVPDMTVQERIREVLRIQMEYIEKITEVDVRVVSQDRKASPRPPPPTNMRSTRQAQTVPVEASSWMAQQGRQVLQAPRAVEQVTVPQSNVRAERVQEAMMPSAVVQPKRPLALNGRSGTVSPLAEARVIQREKPTEWAGATAPQVEETEDILTKTRDVYATQGQWPGMQVQCAPDAYEARSSPVVLNSMYLGGPIAAGGEVGHDSKIVGESSNVPAMSGSSETSLVSDSVGRAVEHKTSALREAAGINVGSGISVGHHILGPGSTTGVVNVGSGITVESSLAEPRGRARARGDPKDVWLG